MQLVNIALATSKPDQKGTELIERADTLCSEVLPSGYWEAIGQVRRLAWVTSELLERLPKVAEQLADAA